MNVLLIGNYVPDGEESMLRFASMMRQALIGAGHKVRLIQPPVVFGRLHVSPVGVGKWLGHVDKFAMFPWKLRSAVRWADIVHICDHSNSHYIRYLRSRSHVITCHDLIGVQTAMGQTPVPRGRWAGRQLQRMIVSGLRRAQHIVCVSQATERQLRSTIDPPPAEVSVIYNGLQYPYSPMPQEMAAARIQAMGVTTLTPFLLHVGGNQWYKNRLGVLQLFAQLRLQRSRKDLNLIMVGKPWTEPMREFVAKHSLTGSVHELTGLSDEDLRALYSKAELMLFPSLDEGFGWPILEAQACGCPVVTTDRPPMNEIGGSAAIYITPENIEASAGAIVRALDILPTLRSPGLANAARFTSAKMIDSYTKLYRHLVSRCRSGECRQIPTACTE